ncbi:MAG: P-II family nitrogen regulator [candidate division WOR-3 bacterium]|jgi:nitrogen regulatory protein PII
MKLIKAYIRTYMSDKTIRALEEIGAPRLTAIDIRALGDEVNPERIEISAEHTGTYTEMVKLEIVAENKNTRKIIDTILKDAQTGYPGDGMIIISKVDEVIKIRTGESEANVSK